MKMVRKLKILPVDGQHSLAVSLPHQPSRTACVLWLQTVWAENLAFILPCLSNTDKNDNCFPLRKSPLDVLRETPGPE